MPLIGDTKEVIKLGQNNCLQASDLNRQRKNSVTPPPTNTDDNKPSSLNWSDCGPVPSYSILLQGECRFDWHRNSIKNLPGYRNTWEYAREQWNTNNYKDTWVKLVPGAAVLWELNQNLNWILLEFVFSNSELSQFMDIFSLFIYFEWVLQSISLRNW